MESLSRALRNALERTQMLEDSISLATGGLQITIGNQINKLRDLIAHKEKTNFLALLSNNVTFQEVSVTLLAVLELIKRNEIIVSQQRLFGPIEILPAQVSSPAHATDTSR
jgi:chromatin segregation and condensation protein Rec8/ScpA/Scc1 (kleisin family)